MTLPTKEARAHALMQDAVKAAQIVEEQRRQLGLAKNELGSAADTEGKGSECAPGVGKRVSNNFVSTTCRVHVRTSSQG